MVGGLGNDTYYVDNANDVIVEAAGGGTDTVIAAYNYTIDITSNLENLTLSGTADLTGTGSWGDNVLTGNNALSGAAGNDTIFGGASNDTYIVDSANDVLVEAAGGGNDMVQSSVNWTLATTSSS